MKLLDTVLHRRVMRAWRRTARNAPAMSLDELRRVRSRGARLSHFLQEALAMAEHRLALPVVGSDAFRSPTGPDWPGGPRCGACRCPYPAWPRHRRARRWDAR